MGRALMAPVGPGSATQTLRLPRVFSTQATRPPLGAATGADGNGALITCSMLKAAAAWAAGTPRPTAAAAIAPMRRLFGNMDILRTFMDGRGTGRRDGISRRFAG